MPQLTTDLDLACARLRAGELLALPTETVYGLAADARNEAAVAKGESAWSAHGYSLIDH